MLAPEKKVYLCDHLETTVGKSIFNSNSSAYWKENDYALIPTQKKGESSKGYSDLLEKVPSHGTDFYRFLVTIRVPFEAIEKSQLLPKHTINLNASPAGSESQEYAEAYLFSFAY